MARFHCHGEQISNVVALGRYATDIFCAAQHLQD